LSVELASPQAGSVLDQPAAASFEVAAAAPGREVVRVELWDTDRELATITGSQDRLTLSNLHGGEHEIKALAYGTYGETGQSEPVRLTVMPVETKAEFLGVDETTRG